MFQPYCCFFALPDMAHFTPHHSSPTTAGAGTTQNPSRLSTWPREGCAPAYSRAASRVSRAYAQERKTRFRGAPRVGGADMASGSTRVEGERQVATATGYHRVFLPVEASVLRVHTLRTRATGSEENGGQEHGE